MKIIILTGHILSHLSPQERLDLETASSCIMLKPFSLTDLGNKIPNLLAVPPRAS